MAKDTGKPRRENYRLWEHEVEPPAKSQQTVIAKIAGDRAASPGRAPAARMSAGGRAARSAGVTEESGLARLYDNGHVTGITNVFDDPAEGEGRSLAMFVAGRGAHRASR